MSHYAKVLNGQVIQVIVADEDFFQTFRDTSPGTWLQTSYRTRANTHPEGTPLRGNYAGVGYHYDRVHDVFYAPQSFPSWTLNNTTWIWEAPIPMPTDGKIYLWNENTQTWIEKNGS